jgi:hypothetical protein
MKREIVEPQMKEEIVFENDYFLIKKICYWTKCSVWRDEETGKLRVLLPGGSGFNTGGPATFALSNGQRATELEFCYLGDFHDGLALVGIAGKGYGFLDKNMNFVIQPKYNNAEKFSNGFAIVSIISNEKEKYIFIDKDGNEKLFEKDYDVICDNSEDTFRVSELELNGWGCSSLAYCSDYSDNAGIWGYTDNSGKEIIKPQYIYAFDFENGLALVCKGEWTKDKKWDNSCNTGKYWTEEELWGMIDKTGKEIVPCKFDEIKFFNDWENRDRRYLQAHFGGWGEGKWGIIDYAGNWVVEPIFEDLDYDITQDGRFAFYSDDKWSNPDHVPMGVYSISEKRVLIEPQFSEIDFMDDGTYKVEIFDEELNRSVEQIIDKAGNPVFKSTFSYLYERTDHYATMIRENDGSQKYGVIEKSGNEILPCKYEATWNGFLYSKKRRVLHKQ